MVEPDVAQQGVVTSLVERELARAPQTRIDFAVLVQIRGGRPRAVAGM